MLSSRASPPSVACATLDPSTSTGEPAGGLSGIAPSLLQALRFLEMLLDDRRGAIDVLLHVGALGRRVGAGEVLERGLVRRDRQLQISGVPRRAGGGRVENGAEMRWGGGGQDGGLSHAD